MQAQREAAEVPVAARRVPAEGEGGDGRARRPVRALRQPREERRGRLRPRGRQGLTLHQVAQFKAKLRLPSNLQQVQGDPCGHGKAFVDIKF